MPRILLLLLSGLLLAGAGLWVHEPDEDRWAEQAVLRLQDRVDAEARALAATTEQMAKELGEHGAREWMRRHVQALEGQREVSGALFVGYLNDTVACWSGFPPLPTEDLLHYGGGSIRTASGTYLHCVVKHGQFSMHGLRPLWVTPPIENRYLSRGFHPSLKVPDGLLADHTAEQGPLVRDADGVPLFRLVWRNGALELGAWLVQKLILFLLAAACLLAAGWHLAMRAVRAGNAATGAISFVVGVVAFRAATLLWLPLAPLDRLPLFDPAVFAASFVFPSLGDLLINGMLMLLCGAFLQRAGAYMAPLPRGPVPALITWLVLFALAAWVTRVLIGLVNDSSIPLDLYHIQGLTGNSLLALLGISAFLGGWILLADGALAWLLPGKRTLKLVLTGLAAIVVNVVVHHLAGVKDTALFLWPVPLLMIMVRARTSGLRFVHLVLGLACCALLVAHVLTRYTDQREERERSVLAERSATREDPVVEQLFRDISPALRRDRPVYAMLAGRDACGPGELDRLVRQRFFTGYWERYDVRLFALGTDGKVLCASDPEPPRSFSGPQSDFIDPTAVADMPDLFIEEQPGRSPFYHARVAIMPEDTLQPGQLIVELSPRSAVQGLGFPSLLLAGEDPLAQRMQRYRFARYENRQLVEVSPELHMPMAWPDSLENDGPHWFEFDGHRFLAQGDPEGTLIVLGLPAAKPLDKATTFSYLFAFFSLLLSILAGIRTILRARGLPSLGIGAKVRSALVLFAIAGLVFFGVGTQRLLKRQYDQRFEASILEKAISVHQELQHRFDGEAALDRSHAAYLDHLLARLSNVFLTDITVYDVAGKMLSTSRPQIFATGLLGHRMDPVAYERVVLAGLSTFVHRESVGSALYRAAYLPLRDRHGMVLAYIALPGFADQAQQEREQADVLVAVVNLFVLLFALSVAVAVFISNWTTRPLDLLKNALGRVALQGANEPIRYRGDDEVGQLVEVYNRKVEELHESAERLARSERESAWREMARQVAHEIKNPLTPMKLSIQHFQRTWTPDAPDAAEKLDRFSRGMVEQIDTLSGIASAFSNFAQMPRAQAEDLDLAEVAEAAMSVFRATPGMRCELRRETTGPLPVHADREQLLRVFNNLIKNAVQAIPEGREGRIAVVLRQAAGEAIAEVHDNGTGIAEKDRERIFRPNFTTKGSGMGLGLAMVQRMVEGAGGRVWFESRVGEGSAFFVTLPLRR